jgi:hypothetical protein
MSNENKCEACGIDIARFYVGNSGSYCSQFCLASTEMPDTNSIQAKEKLVGKKEKTIRDRNVGNSDYAEHKIQPWDIWLEYALNPWDADIVKRVLRKKEGDSRKMDYEKIIHVCQERIRQLEE